MEIIYKYKIPVSPDHLKRFKLYIPYDAEILSVQLQGGKPVIWAKLETQEQSVERTFVIYGTGIEIMRGDCGYDLVDCELNYVGAWQQPPYVWHLFEEIC